MKLIAIGEPFIHRARCEHRNLHPERVTSEVFYNQSKLTHSLCLDCQQPVMLLVSPVQPGDFTNRDRAATLEELEERRKTRQPTARDLQLSATKIGISINGGPIYFWQGRVFRVPVEDWSVIEEVPTFASEWSIA
jgi:hypothetical protein